VVGKSVQMIPTLSRAIYPAFSHVQDSLIWDIIEAQTTPEQRQTLLPTDQDLDHEVLVKHQLEQVLTGQVPATARPLLEQTMAVFYNKALQDLEKMDESEYEPPASEEETDQQRLALRYRSQCRRILEAVLESVQSSFPSEEDG